MIELYERRAAEHVAARNRETERSIRISRLRLATFIPGAAALIWGLARGVDPLLSGLGSALLGARA